MSIKSDLGDGLNYEQYADEISIAIRSKDLNVKKAINSYNKLLIKPEEMTGIQLLIHDYNTMYYNQIFKILLQQYGLTVSRSIQKKILKCLKLTELQGIKIKSKRLENYYKLHQWRLKYQISKENLSEHIKIRKAKYKEAKIQEIKDGLQKKRIIRKANLDQTLRRFIQIFKALKIHGQGPFRFLARDQDLKCCRYFLNVHDFIDIIEHDGWKNDRKDFPVLDNSLIQQLCIKLTNHPSMMYRNFHQREFLQNESLTVLPVLNDDFNQDLLVFHPSIRDRLLDIHDQFSDMVLEIRSSDPMNEKIVYGSFDINTHVLQAEIILIPWFQYHELNGHDNHDHLKIRSVKLPVIQHLQINYDLKMINHDSLKDALNRLNIIQVGQYIDVLNTENVIQRILILDVLPMRACRRNDIEISISGI